MQITHVFFDIGGVLGTNGWDREQRARAAGVFHLDTEFEQRHDEVVGEWESGRMTLADYLETVIFYTPRPFSRDDVIAFMLAESRPFPDSIAIARRLWSTGHLRLFTLNNESADLNQHRIATFGLTGIFHAFLSSCWLGIRKPARAIFERAVAIAQATPEQVLFVDDREQNLAPARRLGMQTHLFTSAAELERTVDDLGLFRVSS